MTILDEPTNVLEADDAAPRSHRLAIASVVCGIGGFLGVTAIVGIVTGAIALFKGGGRTLAIVGIVLSLLWLTGGAYAAKAGLAHVATSKQAYLDPSVSVVTKYVASVQASEYRAARDVSREIGVREMVELKKQILPYGKLQSFSMTGFTVSDHDKQPTRITLSGIGRFENRTARVSAELVGERAGEGVSAQKNYYVSSLTVSE